MNYKVGKKFGIFEYIPKTGANKIRWFEEGDVIDKTTFNRLSKATQAYCNKINTRKNKNSK